MLYVGCEFETALFETMHHHSQFMAATSQAPGWTSQFRELVMDVSASLHDSTVLSATDRVLSPNDYTASQVLGAGLRSSGAEGVIYPSIRNHGGQCAGLFYPDLATRPIQGRHLDYHWDGTRVNFYRDAATHQVFEVR